MSQFSLTRPTKPGATWKRGCVATSSCMAARPSSIALTTVSEGDGLFPGFSQSEQHDLCERSDDERRTAQHSWRGTAGSMGAIICDRGR
jgi:hypothetical protein